MNYGCYLLGVARILAGRGAIGTSPSDAKMVSLRTPVSREKPSSYRRKSNVEG